jgi:glutamine amidotransferase
MIIGIVDYGMGNIRSITTTLIHLGVENIVYTSNNKELKQADKLILPGVGSFGNAMKEMRKRDLDKILISLILEYQKPILGICLGMQLLGLSSTEDGYNKGLGLIQGEVTQFDNDLVKVPHVGFNQIQVNNGSRLYEGFVNENPDFYFTHNYRMHTHNEIGAAYCHYQDSFVASFEKDNIAGTQFHPELSQTNGLKLLKNFLVNF